jgi:hypothetical protein
LKSVAILSPDTVPLCLYKDAPSEIEINNKRYSIRDKCTRSTAVGIRAWNIAKVLSAQPDLAVTLFIPDVNYPGKDNIDMDGIAFDIQPYNLDAAAWDWSEELDRKIINRGINFIIVPSVLGVGFLNCSVLPNNINVILDGYVPVLAELPCSLIGQSNISKKIFWNRFIEQYMALLRRANCILYANDMQLSYYEGQLFSIGKLDWKAYQFSTLLKVPYGIDVNIPIEENPDKSEKLNLLWYGPAFAWYYPEKLLEIAAENPNISIDFVALAHPRYNKSYYSFFKKFFSNDSNDMRHNVSLIEEFQDNRLDVYKDYDAGILLSRDWIEEKYSVRGRIYDMVSHGLPVITNKRNPVFHEFREIKDSVYPISIETLEEDINILVKKKSEIKVSEESLRYLQDKFQWNKVLYPLIDYVRNF